MTEQTRANEQPSDGKAFWLGVLTGFVPFGWIIMAIYSLVKGHSCSFMAFITIGQLVTGLILSVFLMFLFGVLFAAMLAA